MIKIFEIKQICEDYLLVIMELWTKNFSNEFHMTENVIKNRIFEDEDLFKEGSFVLLFAGEIKGIVVTKISKRELTEYENCAWISVLLIDAEIRNTGWGTKLLAMAENALKNIGTKKIIIGGEMNNFFSGIPSPTLNKIKFFEDRGYLINNENHFDLIADVSKLDFEKFNIKMNNSSTFKTVQYSEEYFKKLVEFFDETFPGRWKYEVMEYISTGRELKNILIMLKDDKIIGFCKIFINNFESENDNLYGKNYGSLGPIGIRAEFRGNGVGNRILKDSLNTLKARGAHNVLIDWTILKDFYGQFGFQPLRIYRGAYKYI